ncbi:hypothetical protein N658DRAFT_484880 [Parathielavia hyrcaniae]|uniref:Uncharacterized protein n=1 Tax=Parathielavia hyrcaniae TaxID=113614 RepID=A0AAN6Q499_9PEZI|nr:hypothetical protein N658DRAFT_484880 [Parathielavia hyrcaniae]
MVMAVARPATDHQPRTTPALGHRSAGNRLAARAVPLSGGATAAIVVCIAIVLLAIQTFVCVYDRKKRQQLEAAATMTTTTTTTTTTTNQTAAELQDDPEKGCTDVELPAGAQSFEPRPEELPASAGGGGKRGSPIPSPTPTPTPTPPTPTPTPELGVVPVSHAIADPGLLPELPSPESSRTIYSPPPPPTELPSSQQKEEKFEAPADTTNANVTSPATTGMMVPPQAPGAFPQHESTNTTAETVQDLLMARQAQLEEKRRRLLQLQQIEEEQESIRQQLAVLHYSQQPLIRRPEMP